MKAYHFVGETLKDGSPVPPDGVWLEHTGDVKMCASGLHYSRHPFDALQYAHGDTLCLVEVEDIVEEVADKGVCRRRKIIKRINAEKILREFARSQALFWDMPQIVREYLETGDESKRDAARGAGWAAWDAAWAAWDAAGAAARDAAWEAARAAFAEMVEREFRK